MKKPGKKTIIPALVLAGGLAYQTIADKVKDTYNQIMPETAQHEVAHKDYGGEFLENILEQNKVYAGGLPEKEQKERREANLPEELQGDIFDYFDGEVYKWGSDDFPKDRWNFNDDLSVNTGDLEKVFNAQNPLYEKIGKHFEKEYENGKLIAINYNTKNSKEFAITIKHEGDYFIGFVKNKKGMLEDLAKYDDNVVY